ncbi:hypothetical protein ACQJBY_066243 [Aegilops geniculata]
MPLRRHRPQPLSVITLPPCVWCVEPWTEGREGSPWSGQPFSVPLNFLSPHHASAGLSPGWTLFPATHPWSGRRAGEVSSRWTFFFSVSKGWAASDIG